jgi:CRISPR-associated protein Cas2
MFIVIAYDIQSDRRRTKIVKVLKDYGGVRVNFSVFECRIKAALFPGLKADLEKLIKPRKDSVLFYDLCGKCIQKRDRIGLPQAEADIVVRV